MILDSPPINHSSGDSRFVLIDDAARRKAGNLVFEIRALQADFEQLVIAKFDWLPDDISGQRAWQFDTHNQSLSEALRQLLTTFMAVTST